MSGASALTAGAVLHEWGPGCFADDVIPALVEHLRPDELEIAKGLHPDKNWPPIQITLSVDKRRQKAKGIAPGEMSLGEQSSMLDYRMHVATLLARLSTARAATKAAMKVTP